MHVACRKFGHYLYLERKAYVVIYESQGICAERAHTNIWPVKLWPKLPKVFYKRCVCHDWNPSGNEYGSSNN